MSHDFGDSVIKSVYEQNPNSEAAVAIYKNFHHFSKLYDATGGNFIYGCGSYMFDGVTYRYMDATFRKQETLFNAGKEAKTALEVGVYLGHSLLILLLSNPTLKITCIDNDARYSPKVVDYLNTQFGNRITLLIGNALDVLPMLPPTSYDLIHVDADHEVPAVTQQFAMCKVLAKPSATVVFDDYDATKPLIDSFMETGQLIHVVTPDCLWRNCVTRTPAVAAAAIQN